VGLLDRFAYSESGQALGRRAGLFERTNLCRCGRILGDLLQEGAYVFGHALGMYFYAACGIAHPSAHSVPAGSLIDEEPESYPLYYAANVHPARFNHGLLT